MNRGILSIVVLLLAAHFLLVIGAIKANSPTCDEVAHHIASGYSYLKTGDFRLNPANPPLMRQIAAFPLLFMGLKSPIGDVAWQENNPSLFGRQFFYELGNDPEKIIFWSRFPMALLSLLLGFFVFIWSRKLFGDNGGLLSLSLYAFSPNIVAFAGLATSDFGGALFNFLAIFTLWLYLRSPDKKMLILTGACFGLAQAAKYTNIFLMPLYVAMAFSSLWYRRRGENIRFGFGRLLGALMLIFAIGYTVVFASYFFEVKPLLKNAPDVPEKILYIKKFVNKYPLEGIGLSENRLLSLAQHLPIPFSTYIMGLLGIAHQSMIGLDTFLMGRISHSGFWNYFLIAFMVKTPLPVLFLLLFAVIMLPAGKRRDIYNKLFLLLPIAFVFLVVSKGKVQVGLRHILSVYPLIYVFIGSLALLRLRPWMKKGLVVIAVIWQGVSLSAAYPYTISYFNEFAGGPDNGYKILRDSNVDWGHGLKALAGYLKKNRISEIKLYYFGTADSASYGIDVVPISEDEFEEPDKGSIYAVSAQYMDAFVWTGKYAPVKKVAHSIFIYKF